MSEFQPLHQQIASDQYWQTPRLTDQEHVSFGTQVYDVFFGGAASNKIDGLYRRIAHQGAHVTPLLDGEELAVDVPDGLLKVVEDMRIHPKKKTPGRQYDTPELFDEQAQAMVDEVLYMGKQTGTQVVRTDGTIDVARRTLYLVNSPSGKQLAGKPSELLGRGGGKYSVAFRARSPIGHTSAFETRRDKVETRVASAAIIRPSGTRRVNSRIIDLGEIGARLLPTPKPSMA